MTPEWAIPSTPASPLSLVNMRNQQLATVRELALLAVRIAMESPERFTGPGSNTYVKRYTVREIRSVLEAAGIDWKTHHKELRK